MAAVNAARATIPTIANVAAIAPVFFRKLLELPELALPEEFASIVSMGSTAVGDDVNCPIFVAIKVEPPLLLSVEGIPETKSVVPRVDVVLVVVAVVRVELVEVVVLLDVVLVDVGVVDDVDEDVED